MHGGTSKRGREHPNFKTGKHSKVTRKVLKDLSKLLNRPVQVRVCLYPEGIMETMEKPRPERYFVMLSLGDGDGLPLVE
jgi:hypothetical protein